MAEFTLPPSSVEAPDRPAKAAAASRVAEAVESLQYEGWWEAENRVMWMAMVCCKMKFLLKKDEQGVFFCSISMLVSRRNYDRQMSNCI